MKIGIVSQWYPPEPGPASLPGELARELVKRGHDVQVVTGFPNYPDGLIQPGYRIRLRSDEVIEGVKVRRVAILPSHDDRALARAANYASFGVSAALNGIDCLSDRDVVWVSNSPPTVAATMRRLRSAGIPQVLHVLDLWPDNLAASGMAGDSGGGATLAVAKRLTQETYELADRVLAIAPSVIDLLEARGLHRSKLAYCPLWANEMQFRPLPGDERRAEFGVPDSRVVVLYAGAIGSTQDLDSLVDALGLLPPDVAGSLECWIIGDGLGLPELTRRVRGLPPGSPTVRVLGRRPMAEMASWTAAADICYVGLRTDDHARHTLPSKVQTTLAMAKPLLASVAGDVDALVRDLGVGFSSAGSGPRPLADALSEAVLLGRPRLATLGLAARHVYESQFSLTAAADRLEREFDNLVCPTPIRQVPGLTVRPATRADLDMVTQLHLRSFPGFFLSTLGPRFLALFYEDLLANPEAILLVAVADDREGIVGFVGGVLDESGFFASLKQRRARSFIRASVATAARNPKVVPRLWGARRRDRSPNVGQSGPTLLSIGVDPLAQSTGVGTTLLRAFEDVLFDLGTTDYSLTTDAHGNDAAIGFYVSRGLRPVRQFRTPEGREMLEFVGQASHRPSE